MEYRGKAILSPTLGIDLNNLLKVDDRVRWGGIKPPREGHASLGHELFYIFT
jgi:hypothetical protein